MKHPLAEQYDNKKDEELLLLMRSIARDYDNPKISRVLRIAANRLEEIKDSINNFK